MQQKNKAVLVDVREAKYFNKEHAANCVNVGLFRAVEGRTRLDNLKRLAMAGFAMEATGVHARQHPACVSVQSFFFRLLSHEDGSAFCFITVPSFLSANALASNCSIHSCDACFEHFASDCFDNLFMTPQAVTKANALQQNIT